MSRSRAGALPRGGPTRLPSRSYGIGIVGIGSIARNVHLPAYLERGWPVAAAYDVNPDAVVGLEAAGVNRICASLDELLDDPAVDIVDVATGPAQRHEIVMRALSAGKHVLAQKPFAETLDEAQMAVDRGRQVGRRIAVNVNGRWSPAWRCVTSLIEAGEIGEVRSITHMYDVDFGWSVGSHFDGMPHFVLYDYSVHWIDISRRWLLPRRPLRVRARDFRVAGQPVAALTPWGATVEVEFEGAAHAVIHSIGASRTATPSCPFWVHGSEGAIRGAVLGGDHVELESNGQRTAYPLEGSWFPDGFAGSMAELMVAIEEDREPEHSGADGLATLDLVLACVSSSEADGRSVSPSLCS